MRILWLILLLPSVALAEWAPPENPDPQKILLEASADTQAKRFEVALAKHLWFHQNALKINKAFYGVRLSFALNGWKTLANQHPPALQAMKATRDEAKKQFLTFQSKEPSLLFNEIEALNKTLEEPGETVSLFELLEEKNLELARSVADMAQPALIRAKKYALCFKYLKPDAILPDAVRDLQQMQATAATLNREQLKQVAEKSFTNRIATTIALMVMNDQKQQAADFADKSRAHCDTTEFKSAIESALKGVVPDPWP